jgi:hypothetical protein
MRVGAIGRTRCGKTFLMEQILSAFPRVLAVDNKHRVLWPGFSLTSDPNAALLKDKVVYRPKDDIPDSFWEDAMHSLHERGGGVLYIDEAPEVTSSNSAPSGLKTALRLGGELSVGVYWASQEATGVYNTLIRQSDVLLLFMNQGASDRDKLIQTAGDIGEVTAHLNLFEFVVYQGAGDSYDPAEIPVYKYVNE